MIEPLQARVAPITRPTCAPSGGLILIAQPTFSSAGASGTDAVDRVSEIDAAGSVRQSASIFARTSGGGGAGGMAKPANPPQPVTARIDTQTVILRAIG